MGALSKREILANLRIQEGGNNLFRGALKLNYKKDDDYDGNSSKKEEETSNQQQGRDKRKQNQKVEQETKEKDFLTQAVWYLSEGVGDLLGNLNSFTSSTKDTMKITCKEDYQNYLSTRPTMNLGESIDLLKQDYDKVYFVTGDLNLDLYDENCIFADPFVSFTGLDRFK